MAAGDARTASVRATRQAARQNAAALGNALANHYSPPPKTGGGQPHETIQHAITRMRGQGYSDAAIHGELTNHWGYSKADADRLVYGAAPLSTAPAPLSTTPRRTSTAPAAPPVPRYRGRSGTKIFNPIHDFIDTQIARIGAQTAAGFHGNYNAAHAVQRINVRNGKVSFSGTPAQQREAAGIFGLQGTGNIFQKAGEDLVGMGPGLVELATHPESSGKSMLHYYEQNPVSNFHQDPFMFGLSYVLPAVSGVGGVVGRAGAIGETAGALRAADMPLADIARLRERGALQHYLEHGELPQAGPLTKAGLYARSAIRTPVARDRTFTVGDQTFSAPASHNHIVNLFHRTVTDRLIANALDNGHDILGFRGKIGRHVRANLRVQNAVTNADLTRLTKATKGLSAGQEQAVFILSKGHTPESYARFAQNMFDRATANGDEKAAAFYEDQLHRTKIAAKYLEPGAEDAKVLKAASVIRDTVHRREEFYGRTEGQINHALGSHFYGIHTRANNLPDLHAELGSIEEQHGPPAESPRHYLDQHIANLRRFAAQAGPEHAAELHAEIAHLQTLESDVEFTQHRISQLDQRIEELGPTRYRGRMTEHPDRLAATHRELLVERSRLEDHLNTLVAHERHRAIHTAFEEKGAELRGHVMPSEARTQLLEAAGQHGINPEAAAHELDARALRWARETGHTTRDFYEEYLHSVREGGDVPDAALLEVGPIHRFDTEREVTARRQYEKAGEPKYGNGTLRDDNGHVILGPITPSEWVARVLHTVPDAATRDALARWYESFEAIFRAHFGEDADAIMRGFAVSQANKSPAGGITATLRVFDKVRQGIPVTKDEISTVAQGIEQAVKGQHLLEKGLGQKLSDFTDSLRALDSRTITGHSPEHGAPTAIDVHAARDLGYVDNKLVRRLEGRYGLHKGVDFNVDNPGGSPSGIAYERMVKQYGEITDHLNQIGFDGRHDWTPAQAQALGWSVIQRFHGVEPEDLQFAIDRNTYEIPYEVGNGMEGSRELPAQYNAALRVTKSEEPTLRSIIETNGAYLRGFHYGPGGYEGDINAAGVARVIASPEQADRIAKTIADHFKQWEVWATRPGVTGARSRASLELGHASFRTKGQVEKFWRAFREALPDNLKDKAVGFTPIKYDDNTFGMRIITSHPAFVTSKADDFIDRYHAALETAADKAGIDELGVRANNVEVRPHSGEDQTGSDAGTEAGLEGVGDRAAAEAEGGTGEALHQVVAGEVRGAYNPATREISVGEHADAQTFAHESLHAIRPSLDPVQMRALEHHYGIQNGEWTRGHEEQFVSDMMRAARGEQVAPAVQSVFNASLVAPPEAFYLPFERETKPSKAAGGFGRRAGVHGYGPAQREATHQFTGALLDEGGFRTKASHLATTAFTRASHWKNMTDLHAMLWALSKDTAEAAGKSRFGREPIPIRDIRQIPDSLKEEAYAIYPGDILEGEAPDEIAKRLMEEWTKPPEHGEHVRWINPDFVRPLEPQSMGAALRFVNGINSAFRFGRYLNPGYLRWLPQNLVLNLTQQGPWLFRNARAMFTELGKLDPVVYHQIADNVSFGSARALESETAAQKAKGFQFRTAQAWAHVNDHIPRMLSFIHEAQRAGFKTAKDWETLMTDPRLKSTRDSVIARANKESIDYGAMTPRERVILKSFFAYWPWVRAASLWALRFPFEHPFQTAVLAGGSRDAQKHMADFWEKFGGIAPPYMEGYFPAKKGPVDTSAINPWSQLGEDAQFLAGLTPSHPELAGSGAGTLSPLAKTGAEIISGRDQNGDVPKGGVLKDAANTLGRSFEPFSIYRTATDQQTGSTPKGKVAAILKWLGDPQQQGYDYAKGAKNALRDVNNETRARFMLEHDPNAKSVPRGEVQLVIRVAQIKDQTKSKSPEQIRALELADAAYNGESLSTLNGLLSANKIKPVSQGDLNAERARQRAISP